MPLAILSEGLQAFLLHDCQLCFAQFIIGFSSSLCSEPGGQRAKRVSLKLCKKSFHIAEPFTLDRVTINNPNNLLSAISGKASTERSPASTRVFFEKEFL